LFWHNDQNNLQAFYPTMLHRRKAVGISRDKDYPLDGFCRTKICHVEANAHINALLLEIR